MTLTISNPAADQVVRETFTIVIFADVSTTPGQKTVQQVISEICPQGVVAQQLQDDCDAFVTAANRGDPNATVALSQITPDMATTPANTALNSMALQTSNIAARMAALRGGIAGFSLADLQLDVDGKQLSGAQLRQMLADMTGGAASNDSDSFSRLGGFISGRFSSGSQDRTINVEGYGYHATGLTAGVDYRFSDRLIAGGAIGYAKADAGIDSGRGSLAAKTWSLTVFGTYYQSNQFFVDGSFTYADTSYDQSRRLNFDLSTQAPVEQTFASSFSGKQYGVTVRSGYEMHRGALTLVPGARLQYIKTNVDGYSEPVGAVGVPGSGWGVAMDSQSLKSLTLALGSRVNYAVSQSWGVMLPYAGLEWVHEFQTNGNGVSGHFVNDPTNTTFLIPTDQLDRNYFNLQLGVSTQFANGAAGFINYQRILGYSGLSHYTVNAGVRVEF